MITIDGAKGEGGGQILRSALSLAMCLNIPIEVKNIRAGRSQSGLLRQHYTCAAAAAEISGATVTGLEVGSEVLIFEPKGLEKFKDHYHFAIGTAGSMALVFQTLLPALLMADKPVALTLQGGTHVSYSPTLEFIQHSFIPVLNAVGVNVDVNVESYGFFPVGGGAWTAVVHPWCSPKALNICERGELKSQHASAFVCNLPKSIAERELRVLACGLEYSHVHQVKGLGAGNALSLVMEYDNVTTVFDSIGRHGKTAESVAKEAKRAAYRYQKSTAPVCEYLADQLLIPMVIARGGSFVTTQLTQHSQTNIEVIRQISGCDIRVESLPKECYRVDVPKGLGLVGI